MRRAEFAFVRSPLLKSFNYVLKITGLIAMADRKRFGRRVLPATENRMVSLMEITSGVRGRIKSRCTIDAL